LALEHGHRARISNPDTNLLWIDASSEDTFEKDYIKIAESAGIQSSTTLSPPSCEDVKSWLESSGSGLWLMIIDGLVDENTLSGRKQLVNLLPQTENGSILFTTQDPGPLRYVVPPGNFLHLDEMTPEDAKQLAKAHLGTTRTEDEDLANLVAVLAYCPLTILQATSLIENARMSIPEYLNHFRKGEAAQAELLRQETKSAFESSTSSSSIKACYVSLERIENRNPFAAHVMNLMACFDRIGVPTHLLPTENSPTKLAIALGLLHSLSMITRRDNSEFYDVHALVRIAVRTRLRATNRFQEYLAQAVEAVSNHLPTKLDNRKQPLTARTTILHAIAVLNERDEIIAQSGDLKTSLGMLASGVSLHLRDRGNYGGSLVYAELASSILRSALGQDDKRTLTVLSEQAVVLGRIGRYDEAEKLTREVLERREILLGMDDPDCLTSLNNIATIYRKQGRKKLAEETYRRVVKMKEERYGRNNKETMTSMSNLALALQSQREFNEAIEIFERVIAWRKENLSAQHIATLTSISNLGTVYQLQKKWELAWEAHSEAFTGRVKVLGRNHPETLKSQANMASVLQGQGQYDEAEVLARQVYDLNGELLGSEHPDTLTSMRNLASVLHCQKRYREAEEMSRQAFKISRGSLGEVHPGTVAAKKHADELRSWLQRHPETELDVKAAVD
jgi:tetratricopeptide (TPR) repeat protein